MTAEKPSNTQLIASLRSKVANLIYERGVLARQIERLILNGDNVSEKLEDLYGLHNLVVTWKSESDRATELLR